VLFFFLLIFLNKSWRERIYTQKQEKSFLRNIITILRNTPFFFFTCLSLAEEGHAVVAAPSSTDGGAEAGSTVSLVAETAALATSRGDTASFTVLVDGVDDPVGAGIVADSRVVRIGADDFVPGEDGVSVGPVGVEDTEVTELGTEALFSDLTVVLVELQTSDTGSLGLAVGDTLVGDALAATAADADAEDGEALLGLPAEHAGLISAGGAVEADNGVRVAVLPSTNTLVVFHAIGALLLPELIDIHKSTHWF